MALIKPSNLEQINKTLVTVYNETYKRTDSNVGELYIDQPIGTSNFVHSFILGMPDYRNWVDSRIVNSVKIEEIAGKTEKKELTIGIDVEDMLSDVTAPLISQLGTLGMKAKTLPDKMLAEFLINGTSTTDKYKNFDAKPLFATDHPLDSGGTQSNNITSNALSAANLITSFEAMMGYTDPLGAPLAIMPTHLVVPSALYLTACQLVQNPINASGETNVMFNRLKVVHLPELDAYTTTWYLMSVHNGTAPFMQYTLEAPLDTLLNDPSDPNYFYMDQVVYGSTARVAMRAGAWMQIQRNIA
jgi:phage major head subunit gpT-like protein